MADSVLVTGGSGFIGACLVRRLLARGWQVHVLLRPGSSLGMLDQPAHPALRLHRHDGSTADLAALLQAAAPSAVFHLAAQVQAYHSMDDVAPMVRSTVELTTQLAEAMARSGTRLLVTTGTYLQHYQNAAYNPACLYAALKQGAEAVLRYYCETAGLRVGVLKLTQTYGPGDPRPRLMTLLSEAALSGRPLAMSAGEQMLDLVYIDDVLDALEIALQRLRQGTDAPLADWRVASGAPLTLREVAALFSQVSGRPLAIEWGARDYRPREIMEAWTSQTALPAWHPAVALADGMLRTLDWHRQRLAAPA